MEITKDFEDKIRNIILDIIELEADEIDDEDAFVDHDVDSLMALDILTEIEQQHKTKFPEEVLKSFTSIKSITRVIAAELAKMEKVGQS